MTTTDRIAEIKARMKAACAGAAYLDCEGMPMWDEPNAEDDLKWLLDRIELLQRTFLRFANHFEDLQEKYLLQGNVNFQGKVIRGELDKLISYVQDALDSKDGDDLARAMVKTAVTEGIAFAQGGRIVDSREIWAQPEDSKGGDGEEVKHE